MKKQNVCIAKEIDLTDYRELTEAELILVNGGREVENSNAGVANAQVGDTVQNSGSIGYQPQGSQGDGTGAGSSSNPGYSYNGGYGNLPDSLNPNSPSFSAADIGYYQSMNSMANLQSSNVQSETCAEVDVGAAGNKNAITRVFSKLFQNDGSKRVFTAGVSGSATYVAGSNAISAGVYINPRNDSLFVISAKLVSAKNPVIKMAGTLLMAGNIEDAGGYLGFSAGLGLGFSASFGGTVGVFKNIDSLKGSCIETGVSGGPPGFSLGADELVSLDQQLIGVTTSLGIGAGTPFEAHGRLGTTITYGISNTLGAKQ